jgi:hypothetical protein
MDTAPLKSFATWARTALIREVTARIAVVLAPASSQRVEAPKAVAALEEAITSAGGGDKGRAAIADRVAYTWFNRIIALRFMDANSYTGIGIVSPQAGVEVGQPEILAEAKRASMDPAVVSQHIRESVSALLNGTRRSDDPQGEAYALLLAEYCRHWNRAMPFMFEREGDLTELLMPANLLTDDSVPSRATKVLTEEVCQDVEVIGWLYQFYISERKDEVFARFTKNLKAGPEEIPAATQLFTPHWIVRYLVENSLGRLWMLNHPTSRLVDRMQYYIAPVGEQNDYLKIEKPEQLKLVDPACGSGHMLTYAFDLIYEIYEEAGYAPSEIPSLILNNNLYGIEIDPRASALAAFALMMKARRRQRTFLNGQIKPNVCVLGVIHFTARELEILVAASGDRSEEEGFWNQFRYADCFGSLIQIDPDVTARLSRHLVQLDDGGDLLAADTLMRAQRVVKQATYLAPRYMVVVANPPYMGSGNMNDLLADFAKTHYPLAKSDLMTMFIERASTLVMSGGIAALVTRDAWMFLSRFSEFREWLLAQMSIASLAHFGQGVFVGIPGAVVQVVGLCLTRGRPDGSRAYIRLTDSGSSEEKAAILKCAAQDPQHVLRFAPEQKIFSDLPGTPIAYWASEALRSTFSTGLCVEDVAPVRQGFQTGDNERFMRFWFEVSRARINFSANSTEDFHASRARFAPYLKGGGFRKWYGNDEYVVAFDETDYAALAKLGNKLPSRSLYFKDSITWSALSSGDFGARYAGVGSTFSAKGACAFPIDSFARDLVLAVFNSSVTRDLLEFMGATLDFNVGALRQIPIPAAWSDDDRQSLQDLVTQLISIHREDWSTDEYAPGFTGLDLIQRPGSALSLAAVVNKIADRWLAVTAEVRTWQSDLDQLVAGAYGLVGDFDLPTSLRNGVSDADQLISFKSGRVLDLVSYAVGCMFGRYSVDEPGLILADQGATLQDYLAQVPSPSFSPDVDNVIPIVDGDWFEDGIATRFRQWLRGVFGEMHFEENLRFVTEALGVKDLRDYFVKSFYKDHVQRYRKRPIYWLFSSPKGSFNALIYVHRYTPSTVSTVLNEYLREFKAKLSSTLQQQERLAAGGGTPRQQAAAQKEADRIRKMLLELDEYEHDVLYPLASQQIEIDLDDGVRVNYPKFGAALKKIPGLETAE